MRAGVFLFLVASFSLAAEGDLQFAKVGNLKLFGGGRIEECVIAYRAYGTLNAGKTNAVLFPTWFTGRSESLASLIGPGKLLDSGRFYVIAVDALGDGHSSSPSNSNTQPRMKFPEFSIRDMVESEHALLVHQLGITHLRAVVGISMGGMQTFQWMVSFPAFLDFAIPIVGSPQLASTDMLLWNAEMHAIEAGADWKGGNYGSPPSQTMRAVSDIHQYALTTPAEHAESISRAAFGGFLGNTESQTLAAFDANDWLRQLQAMLTMDVAAAFQNSLTDAAKVVRARALIVVAEQDHMVNPLPALAFAKQIRCQTLVLTGSCGHLATGCESAKLNAAVRAFLQ